MVVSGVAWRTTVGGSPRPLRVETKTLRTLGAMVLLTRQGRNLRLLRNMQMSRGKKSDAITLEAREATTHADRHPAKLVGPVHQPHMAEKFDLIVT